MRTLPLVQITWLDSCAQADWLHAAEADMPVAEITSVGWLLQDTPQQITIAQSVDWEGKTGERLTVPRGVVTRVRRIT